MPQSPSLIERCSFTSHHRAISRNYFISESVWTCKNVFPKGLSSRKEHIQLGWSVAKIIFDALTSLIVIKVLSTYWGEEFVHRIVSGTEDIFENVERLLSGFQSHWVCLFFSKLFSMCHMAMILFYLLIYLFFISWQDLWILTSFCVLWITC